MGLSKNAIFAGVLSLFVGGVYAYTYKQMSKVRASLSLALPPSLSLSTFHQPSHPPMDPCRRMTWLS